MSEQLLDVLRAQRRRRRAGFWLGFFAILVVGGLWAQLSKDPIGPDFMQDFGVIDDAVEVPAFEVPAIEAPPPIETTVAPATTEAP